MCGGGVQWPRMQDVHVSRAECHIVQVCIAHAVHSDMLLVDLLMQCVALYLMHVWGPPDGCADVSAPM